MLSGSNALLSFPATTHQEQETGYNVLLLFVKQKLNVPQLVSSALPLLPLSLWHTEADQSTPDIV